MTDDRNGNGGPSGSGAAYPPIPLENLRFVSDEMLAERLEAVKTLEENDNEAYMIEKDSATGRHYLHYAVRHLNLAGGGAEEAYHHLMPLAHDDVIALALGAGDYRYPEDWKQAYLRNGPNGGYVWYDPSGAADDAGLYDSLASEIRVKLETFRSVGRSGEDDVKRLLEDVDRLFGPDLKP